jgi:hypothetical protein
MDEVVLLMQKPAPKHVIDGLCQRLREIELHEADFSTKQAGNKGACLQGSLLADECRKYIYSQDEILWMHVLVSAYYINGGVMLREAVPSSPNRSHTETDASRPPPQKTLQKPLGVDMEKPLSEKPEVSLTEVSLPEASVPRPLQETCGKTSGKTSNSKPSDSKTSDCKTAFESNGDVQSTGADVMLKVHIPEMLEMEEMIRSMNIDNHLQSGT